MQHPIKVLIGSGPRIFREFLNTMLQSRQDFEVVDTLFDGLDIIQSATLRTPDLLILDLFLPRFNGISVINAVRTKCPRMKILILTDYESEEHVSEAFHAGAHGYCTKNTSTKELREAIKSVMSGKTFISPSVAVGVMEGCLDGRKNTRVSYNWESVTKREREVLKLLAEAHKNTEIAKILCISPKTVEKHRSNIMRKLSLHTVAGLTRYAHDHGLVKNGPPPTLSRFSDMQTREIANP
ncbi:response regulator [Desulfonatronum thioautotrophicum]|uniref:response regulator n=1 Tax=Desulfonatronum thioautotrophicum TaxID=617001 RepID=UPI00069B851F|nr:response regulator transcription factor [Desulfonatronum thioautotrophicum]